MTLTYQQEQPSKVKEEISAFLPAQWAHTGDAELECKPNWGFYSALEVSGALNLLTAREDGRLIGYMIILYHPHVNSTDTKIASVSTYFIEPRPNRSLVLRAMFSQALTKARHKGVEQLKIRTEFHNSCGRLLEAMGFLPEEIGYKMALRPRLSEAKSA